MSRRTNPTDPTCKGKCIGKNEQVSTSCSGSWREAHMGMSRLASLMVSLPAAQGRREAKRRHRVAVEMELAGGGGADLSLGDSWA